MCMSKQMFIKVRFCFWSEDKTEKKHPHPKKRDPWLYIGESKVLQYFGNMWHSSAVLDAFGKVMKVMNHTRLWNALLIWYSLSATHKICLYGLEYSLVIHSFRPTWPSLIIKVLGIHSFRPTWPSLIIKVLAIWMKFLECTKDIVKLSTHFGINIIKLNLGDHWYLKNNYCILVLVTYTGSRPTRWASRI